jgi:hypothetical protein
MSDRQIEGVKEVALAKSSRLQDAMKRYNDAMSAQIKKGVPADKASRFASKELDEVAELVKRHAVEAKDSDPTVLLDIAAALTSLEPAQRQMILRRAGSPEVFASLENVGADPLPLGATELDAAAATAQTRAADKAAGVAESRKAFPAVVQPSQNLQKQGAVTKKGKPLKASQVYKSHQIEDVSPLETDTSDRREIIETEGAKAAANVPLTERERAALQSGVPVQRRLIETQGAAAAAKVPLTSTQRAALQRLAGDQIGQVKRIEARQRAGEGLDQKSYNALSPEEQAEADRLMKVGAYLPPIKGAQADERIARDTLRIGTSQSRPQGKGEDSARQGGRSKATIDESVEGKNQSHAESLISTMYKKTDPGADANDFINLNEWFPLFRARMGEMDADGTLQYPSEAPNAEWLTGFMQAALNVHDPEWKSRMLPLVERSLANTPASTGTRLMGGGELQTQRSKTGRRTAAFYDKTQFVPSPNQQSRMEKGLRGKGEPVKIYGGKPLDRPALEAPSLTPQPIPPKGKPIDEGKKQEVRDAIEEYREKMRQKRGNSETASIYTVPETSPLRSLMA